MPVFTDHPQRRTLSQEIRARPYPFLSAPVLVSHLAVMSGEHGIEEDRAYVARLCETFSADPPEANARHFAGDLGPFRLKWERHTEFTSYTFFSRDGECAPFENTVITKLPADWLAGLPGQVLAAIHLHVEGPDAPEQDPADLFKTETLTGSTVMGDLARVWMDFHIRDDGFTRILVRDDGLSERQLGRIVQRLLEVGSYRMLAMLGFPVANEALPKVAAAEETLNTITVRLAESGENEDEQALLKELSTLAAETEALAAATSYRFNASRAYYTLVRRRIEELREDRLEPLQPLGQFLFRRLTPAVETCDTMLRRQESLSRRIGQVSNLLQTQVNVALQEQNRDLLTSMDRRADLQARLQGTVKWLSAFAISYYLLGMIGYLAKAAKAGGLEINTDIVIGLSFPLVGLFVWAGVAWLRRVQRAISVREEEP